MNVTLANRLTIGRFLMVPLFIITMLYYSPGQDRLRYLALGIFLGAMFLDVLDGYVARKYDQETKAGAIMDPLADKVLLISAYLCINKIGIHFSAVRFPIWLIVAVISRDFLLLLGFTVIRLFNAEIKIEPTVWGKAAVFFQSVAVVGFLVQLPELSLSWYLILVLVIISGIDYILKGVRALNSGAQL